MAKSSRRKPRNKFDVAIDANTKAALPVEVRELQKYIGRLHRERERFNANVDILKEAFLECYSEPLDVTIADPPKLPPKKMAEEAVLHVSDVHTGKTTPLYNSAMSYAAYRHVAERVAEIVSIRRTHSTISTLHVFLGGDMVEGEDIFAGQAHSIDLPVVMQAIKGGPEACAGMLLSLLQVFPKLRVYGVPGNHGRNGPKKSGGSKKSNWDSVFYEAVRWIVSLALAKNNKGRIKGVSWDLPLDRTEQWYTVAKVCGYGCLLIHGEQLRGGSLGFPWYSTDKKTGRWIDAIDDSWDFLFCGHFHNENRFHIGRRTVCANGTTELANTWAKEELAQCSIRAQRLAFFNSKYGMIADSPIYFERRKPNK